MFGNYSNTRSLPLQTKKTSGQNSPMTERALDDRSSFDQSTSSTITLTDHNVGKMIPQAPPEHTSTPIATSSTDVADFGRSSSKSKAHRRSKSLERGFNTSIKLYDNSGLPIPKHK